MKDPRDDEGEGAAGVAGSGIFCEGVSSEPSVLPDKRIHSIFFETGKLS